MLTESDILRIAEDHIKALTEKTQIEVIIIHKYTMKKPYGNIYFYTSKKYFETRNTKYAIAGNAPFLVEYETGRIVTFGTGRSTEYYISEYEAGHWPDNRRLVW